MEKGEGRALAVVMACALFAGGWMLLPQYGVFREPHSLTKTFALLSVLFFVVATPFAIAEARGDRRFRLTRQRIEAERAWDRVAPYEGPFGRGLAFEAPDRRVLLLHPAGGLGPPFVVEERLTPPPPQPEPQPEAPADAPPGEGGGVEIPVYAEPERA